MIRMVRCKHRKSCPDEDCEHHPEHDLTEDCSPEPCASFPDVRAGCVPTGTNTKHPRPFSTDIAPAHPMKSGAAEQSETAPSEKIIKELYGIGFEKPELPKSNPPMSFVEKSEIVWNDHVGKMKDIARGFPIEKYSVDDGTRKVPNKSQHVRGGSRFTCPMCSNFTCTSHSFLNIGYFHQFVDNHIGENHPNWKELLKYR